MSRETKKARQRKIARKKRHCFYCGRRLHRHEKGGRRCADREECYGRWPAKVRARECVKILLSAGEGR